MNFPNPLAARMALFPTSARIENDCLTIGGLAVDDLAQEYGTPLYVYDRATLDGAVRQYREALAAYPGESRITYAGKAYLCLAIAQWTQQHEMWLDCTGAGEIAIATAAGVSRRHILVHGVNKSQADLAAALEHAGTIVVDNLSEMEQIIALLKGVSSPPELWLRLRPGVAVDTHSYTQTGQGDSKFGVSPAEFIHAVRMCQGAGLPLTGLHFHQGSHFHDPSPLVPALETALDLVAQARQELNWTPQTLSPGGGWGIPYHEDDLPHQPIASYVGLIVENLVKGCRQRDLPLPALQLEPGRSLVGQAGVGVYEVHSVKHTATRRWLLLDGGMADNPRPALYGARYSALPARELGRPLSDPAWLGGPFCESGDILIHGLPMPEMHSGERLAIPVSGAYQLSMGSNYNGARRPAVVLVDGGRSYLIQRRETLQELLRRDQSLQK
jgi:diaminopimelate decarboxylase